MGKMSLYSHRAPQGNSSVMKDEIFFIGSLDLPASCDHYAQSPSEKGKVHGAGQTRAAGNRRRDHGEITTGRISAYRLARAADPQMDAGRRSGARRRTGARRHPAPAIGPAASRRPASHGP